MTMMLQMIKESMSIKRLFVECIAMEFKLDSTIIFHLYKCILYTELLFKRN